jgi:hypothetical protein
VERRADVAAVAAVAEAVGDSDWPRNFVDRPQVIFFKSQSEILTLTLDITGFYLV